MDTIKELVASFDPSEAKDAVVAACEAGAGAAAIAAEHAADIAKPLAAAVAKQGPKIAAEILSALHTAAEEGSEIGAQLFALLKQGMAAAGELAAVLEAGLPDEVKAALEAAAAAAGDAAAAAAAAAGDAAPVLGAAAADAAGAISGAAADAAPVVAEALGAAAGAIGDGAGAAGEAAGDVWEAMQPGLAALGDVTWDDLDAAYTMGADEVADALQVLAGAGAGCLAFFDLLDLEILRDAFQTVGLFFSTIASAAFGGIAKIFGNLGNIIAVDLSYVTDSVNPETMLVLLFVVSALSMLVGGCFLCNAFKLLPSGKDEVEQGAEAIDFERLAADNPSTMKWTKRSLTMLGFIYLPVSKISVQVMHCDYRDPAMLKMLGAGYPCDGRGVKFLAFLGLLLVTLIVPVAFAKLVNKAKPRGSLKDPTKCYDEDGLHLVEFSDKMYLKRMKTDPAQVHSPFLFLYSGFERQWSGYKSFVMFVKFLLILPCVVCVGNLQLQAVLSLVVLIGYAAVCLQTTPYIDHRKDKMEAVGRVAAVVTMALALVAGAAGAAAAGAAPWSAWRELPGSPFELQPLPPAELMMPGALTFVSAVDGAALSAPAVQLADSNGYSRDAKVFSGTTLPVPSIWHSAAVRATPAMGPGFDRCESVTLVNLPKVTALAPPLSRLFLMPTPRTADDFGRPLPAAREQPLHVMLHWGTPGQAPPARPSDLDALSLHCITSKGEHIS